MFVKPASGWKTTGHYTAELTDNGGFDVFGTSVAKSGARIVGGASYAAMGSNKYEGASYVFTKPKSGWKTTQKFNAKLTPSNGQYYQFFGNAVAILGRTIVIGAPDTTVGNNSTQGAGYVFTK